MLSENFGDEDGGIGNFVRWYDVESAKYQEDPIEILSEENSKATIWTAFGLLQETPVYIKTDSYTGNGIVTSAIPEDKGYRVIIRLDREDMLNPYSSEIDPGVFALERFLTEEEENKILESLGDELDGDADLEEAPSDPFKLSDVLRSALSSAVPLAAVAGPEDPSNRVQ